MNLSEFMEPMRGDYNGVINDNEIAQGLAVMLGVADKFRDKPGTQCAFSRLHPSHWAIVTKTKGHPDDSQNGWCLMLIPKNRQTEQQVRAQMKELAPADLEFLE